jgi:S1-C subfamily serine protease
LRTLSTRSVLAAVGCALLASCAGGTPTADPAGVPLATMPTPTASRAADVQEARDRYLVRALAPHLPAAVEGMRLSAVGTGIFIATDRLLTNYHVIGGGCRAYTVGNNTEGEEVEAKIVAADPQADLAVLSAEPKDVRPAKFLMEVLQETADGLAIVGYPEHGLPVLQAEMGHVAVFQDDLESAGRLFRFFGPVRRGNSGGPLLSSSGAVVGVVTAKVNTVAVYQRTGEVVDDVGYAIGNRTVFDFLVANQIRFEPATPQSSLSSDELLQRAHEFVRQVGCWK